MISAKELGYYRYPRKINITKLSEKIGVDKATVREHLRKAEEAIMAHVFSDT